MASPTDTLALIHDLVARRDVRISEHGYDEAADDDILIEDIIDGFTSCELIEDYPEFGKGPSVLVLERDREGRPIHVVWSIPRGYTRPAVVVTAYRPDPKRWTEDFKERLE